MSAIDDLLLFRAVDDAPRSAIAAGLLDEGMVGRRWRHGGQADLWELRDAAGAIDEKPVAVAATRPLGDGRRVRLLAVVVASSQRGRGIGRRMIEDLADALRAQGVLSLVAAVPSDQPGATVVMQRAGLRPSHIERANPETEGRDLVWFDLEL
ncbi:MAG TPA: GNAT family N-acetyltransferase [Acidimicrobiales bacterium]|nr:GNAT family N-acetyltransferase [Acidimicrobiales bacterium]